MKHRLLRLFLFVAAFGWCISALGTFLPWDRIVFRLQCLSAGNIPSDPMLNYWLRMTAGSYTGIGIFLLVLALRPAKFACAIPWAGALMAMEGIILLTAGLRLGLPPFPWLGDTCFCLFIGLGILLTASEAKTVSNNH